MNKFNFYKAKNYLAKLMPYIKECQGTMNYFSWLKLVDSLENLDREFNIKIQEARRERNERKN